VIVQTQGKEPQLRSDAQRAREYEMLTIFAPDIPEENLTGAIERVSEIIATSGGTVTSVIRESPWGRRRLAYPIRHEGRDVRDGIYALYYFELDASKVVEIERDLKLTTNILRFMVTHQIAIPPQPETPEAEFDQDDIDIDAEMEAAGVNRTPAAAQSAEAPTADAGVTAEPAAEVTGTDEVTKPAAEVADSTSTAEDATDVAQSTTTSQADAEGTEVTQTEVEARAADESEPESDAIVTEEPVSTDD
jgi:small subunit ribosomal protein S6